MKKIILFSLISVIYISCNSKGKNNPQSCNGNTRREIKICTDSKSELISLISEKSTIGDLGNISVPLKVKSETERLDLELRVYEITGKVDKCKKEHDGDYHIRLIDSDGNYIICESANPDCHYTKNSKFISQIIEVRDFVKSNEIEGKTVTITGVAFIDIDHVYARKQAKNNIELHPILKITF